MFPLILLVVLLRSTVTFQKAFCENVFNDCVSSSTESWTSCYDKKIRDCSTGRINRDPNFIHEDVKTTQQFEKQLPQHSVSVPASALQRSRSFGRSAPGDSVVLVITVLNSTYFQPKAPPRGIGHRESNGFNNYPLGGSVLVVKVGKKPVRHLSQPILLVFKHNQSTLNGSCVFWNEEQTERGWSTEGCNTSARSNGFLCSCDHLSFFAVLVNPTVSLDRVTAVNLAYISIVGSALSVIFSPLSLIIYACLQRRRPDKSIGVHMQLTGAILCLHLSLLLGCLWAWLEGGGWPCAVFGALLHWSLLGTFTWTAIEGFHLYMLLVRVFNVYIRKYLLKLSLVGWGVPTVIALTCGILDVYGKYTLLITDDATNTTLEMCWIKNVTTDGIPAINILMLTYVGLVLLFNSAMLGLVLVKLRSMRNSSAGFSRGTTGNDKKWKLMDKEKSSRLCKDLATVLGLSCVLGLAWGFSYTTFSSVSTVGVYLFTILNSLQGVFMFLWSLALTCKSRSENNSSAQYPSTKKTMETSFNT